MRQIFDLDTRLGRRVNVFITAVIVLIGLGAVQARFAERVTAGSLRAGV